jgi:hypothetical protein
MDYIIAIIVASLAFFALFKAKLFASKHIKRSWIGIAFGVKLMLAIAMVFIYSRNEKVEQKADIFRYYADAKVISQSLYNEPSAFLKLVSGIDADDAALDVYYIQMNNWDYSYNTKLFSNNRLLIKLLSIVDVLFFGSYWAIVVFFSFISFIGLWWIFSFFSRQISTDPKLIFGIVFFIPSIAFWSAGVLKESMIIFFLGLLLNCFYQALKGRKAIVRAMMLLLSIYFLFMLKAFVAMLLLPAILGYLWNRFFPKQRSLIPYFIMYFVAFSLASESGKYLDTGLFDLMVEKQIAFTDLAMAEDAQSLITPIYFEPNSISIAANSPIALVNSLFRPVFWEVNSPMMAMASFENFFLFLLVLLIIIFPRKNIENANLLWFGLTFSLSYLILIGLTTPVLGAISRYRIPGLLFLAISLIQVIDLEEIKGLISRKK